MEMIQQHLQNMQQIDHHHCCSCPPVHVLLGGWGGIPVDCTCKFLCSLLLIDGIRADFAVFPAAARFRQLPADGSQGGRHVVGAAGAAGAGRGALQRWGGGAFGPLLGNISRFLQGIFCFPPSIQHRPPSPVGPAPAQLGIVWV